MLILMDPSVFLVPSYHSYSVRNSTTFSFQCLSSKEHIEETIWRVMEYAYGLLSHIKPLSKDILFYSTVSCWKVSQSYDEMRDGNRRWKVTISEIVLYISK